MTRRLAYVLSVALVVWAAASVPMPFSEVRPGDARPGEALLELSAATSDVNGDLSLLTVRQHTPNVLGTVWAGLHPGRDLLPASQRTPGGLDPDEYREVQRQAFDTSVTTALAVAATAAGYDVELRTQVVVAQVMPGGPSDGVLRPGDTITAVDGVAVTDASQVIELLRRSDEPRDVTLTVHRDEDVIEATIGLRQLPGTDRPVLGILVETLASDPDLPFEADVAETRIIGPSAGLMLALAATDLLLEEDLAGGRTVTGTGTIAADGTVGRVTGVPQKARAAVAAEADLLLVPLAQVAEATAAIDAGIEVVGVQTFQDAIDVLRGGDADGVAAPR